MSKAKILSIISIVVLLTSCYEDKGNYDYHDINELKINGLPTEEQVKLRFSERISVEPTIVGTMDKGEDSYEYRWVAIDKTESSISNGSHIIGNSRKLDYLLDIPEGSYWVYCYVKDKDTGVEWSSKFGLKVTSATRDGWLILQSEAGRTRLDMISFLGTNTESRLFDMLKDPQMPYKQNPKMIMMATNMMVDYYTPGVVLVTENGSVTLNPATLQWEEALDFKYEFGEDLNQINVNNIIYGFMSGQNTILTDDYIYTRSTQSSGSIYGMPINKIAGEPGYVKVAPYFGTNIDAYAYEPTVIFYDVTKKRFVQMSSDNKSLLVPTATENVFPNTTGKDMVTMQNVKHGGVPKTFAILKDAQNKVWLYGFDISYALTQLKDYYYQIEAPGIETATKIAIHPYNVYLFYVSGNKIYQYDMATKECKPLAYSFDGEDITFIKFNILYSGNYGKPQAYKDMEYRLLVGSSKKGAAPAECGVIRMFDISNTFSKDATLFKQYDGFATPVDMVYRERL